MSETSVMSVPKTSTDLTKSTSSPASGECLTDSDSAAFLTQRKSGRSGSRAKTSQRQGGAKGSKASGAGCSSKSCGCSTELCEDPIGCSLRTYLLSACEGLTGLSLKWKNAGTPAGRQWWVLGRQGRRTNGIESGCWATPTVTTALHPGRVKLKPGQQDCLSIQAHRCLCATPRASDAGHSGPNQRDSSGRYALMGQVVRQWPTPASLDWRDDGNAPSAQNRKSPCLPAATVLASHPAPANPSTNGKFRGSLNSQWVAQLMGYPSDWCVLPIETH